MKKKASFFLTECLILLLLSFVIFSGNGLASSKTHLQSHELTTSFNQFENDCLKIDFNGALSALKKIETWKLDQGLRNVPFVSAALVKTYENSPLYKENSSLQRFSIYNYICELSPDEPKFQWISLKRYFYASPFDIYHLFKKFHSLKRAIKTNLGWTLNKESELILALFLGLFFSVFYFALILILKYASHLVFYMRRFLRFPINKLLAILLILIIFMLPVYFNFGFVWIPLFCMSLLWLLLSKGEKGATFLFLVVFLFLSLGVKGAGRIFTAVENRQSNLIYLANYNQLEPVSLKRLERATKGYRGDPDILFTLGLVAKRHGDYKKAVKYYLAAIKENKNFAVCMNNLGNVYLLSNGLFPKNVELARKWYKKAIKIDPTRAEFYYNLSKSYPLLQVEGMEYIVKARDLNPLLIDTLTRRSSDNPNQRLADCLLPTDKIRHRALSESNISKELSLLLWRFFLNSPLDNPYVMPAILFFMVLIFTVIQRKVELAVSCENCGQLFFKAIPIHYSQQLCHQCQMIRKRSTQADPELVKQKEIEVSRFRRRKKLEAFFVGLLPAGGVFFLKGQAMVGALTSFVFYYFLGYFLISHQMIGNLGLWFFGYASHSFLSLALAVVLYLVCLIPFILLIARGEI